LIAEEGSRVSLGKEAKVPVAGKEKEKRGREAGESVGA